MIRRVNQRLIDRDKYQKCIKQSKQYRIYAEDWYLDAHTNRQWDCLVFGDYEAVMPLPFVRKLGVKIVIQPVFVQQLGIFSTLNLSNDIIKEFLNQLYRFNVGSYQLNAENALSINENLNLKNNYILNLDNNYEVILKNYRSDRRKDIKRIEKLELEINKDFVFDIFLKEIQTKYPHLNKYYSTEIFKNFLKEIVSKKLYTYYDLRENGQIISSIFIIHSCKRRILLLSSKSNDSKYKGAFAYLIDHFIKLNSNTELIFDFEGSMIKSIADFNKSFGAEIEYYPIIIKTKKELLMNVISKVFR